MDSKTKQTIFKLNLAVELLRSIKREENLTDDDYSALNTAISYFGEDYHFEDYQGFLHNLPISAITDEIARLEKPEEKEEEKKEQVEETSIPPELESLVAEYRDNQLLLEQEEVKQSRQRSVAEQVKIAIAHRKTLEQIQANRERRLATTDGSAETQHALVELGSPKSESYPQAVASSFAAVKQIAFTYSGFTELPPEIQNQIITSAVELNTIGVTDLDAAVQASVLQLDTQEFTEPVKKSLATIPGGYVSFVYQEVEKSRQATIEVEQKIIANEDRILTLQKEGKTEEAQSLIEENQHLAAFAENQQVRLTNKISRQTESFQDYERSRQVRLSKDPDLEDLIETANKNISSIHDNLETNGVTPHRYSPMDEADLLEEAIRRDLPGELRPNAGYEAEYAAAIVSHPKTQSQDLSPQAILLYGKDLTPKLLAKARKFAEENPTSALGTLFKTRQDIFSAASTQLRKIDNSPLGKEIVVVKKGIGKVFDGATKFLGKISDKIPGGFGTIISFVQDPWGTLRSWAGRKAGEFIVRRLVQSIGNETLKKGAEILLKNGLKESVKKLAQQAAAKAAAKVAASTAAKVGAKVALQAGAQAANVVPGLGLLIALAIEVVSWLGEKIFGALKQLSTAIYGEEVKAHELLAVPVAGAAAAITAIGTFFVALGTATVAAAGSAIAIVALGSLVGFFFYVTSIVTAPLISTLVQLEGSPRNNYTIVDGCAGWPTEGQYTLGQGPLGTCTHKNGVQGIDIEAPEFSSFITVAPGTVVFAGNRGDVYGNLVIVSSQTEAGSFDIWYAHLSDIGVTEGDSVQAGSEVGLVGGTGGWSPHIHMEYRGMAYNTCPAGGIPVPEGCCNYGGEQCLFDGQPIISNQLP